MDTDLGNQTVICQLTDGDHSYTRVVDSPPAVRFVDGAAVVGGFAASVLVALAWVPLRGHQPSVVVGLLMVVVVTAVGYSGRRAAVAAAALGAAAGFTFFDTVPYEHFSMSRQPDVVTAVALVMVGLVTGELSVRVARQRRADGAVTGDLSRVREAASLLAAGEELVVMIGAVAHQLERQLHLADCWFVAEPIPSGTPTVQRAGTMQPAPGLAAAPRALGESALPVWGLGKVLGHFVLRAAPGVPLSADRLQTAVTLADQVGAALAAQAPPPELRQAPAGEQHHPDGPPPGLRVIH